jgi:hypothetical protein
MRLPDPCLAENLPVSGVARMQYFRIKVRWNDLKIPKFGGW